MNLLTGRLFWLILAAALAMPGALRAQQSEVEAPPAQRETLAHQIEALAWMALDSQGTPRSDQLDRAQVLLDLATSLWPGEPDRWLLQAELAGVMQNAQARAEALQNYLRLIPSDDATQLDLIMLKLDEFPTLDERLTRVETILRSGSGQRLTPALRSRLASYAAVATQELGKPDRYKSWLGEAVRLDPTNAQAAEQLYRLAVENKADSGRIGSAAANLVVAAPASPTARINLAEILLKQAAYGPSASQYEAARQLAVEPLPREVFGGMVIAMGAGGDAAGALDLLRALEAPIDTSEQGMTAAPATPSADQPVLPPNLELVRLVLLSDSGRTEAASQSLARIERSILAQEPTPRAWAELALSASVAGLRLEETPTWLDRAGEEDSAAVARGWVALQRGDEAAARRILTPVAKQRGLAALGVALLEQDPTAKALALNQVIHAWPTDVAAVLASRKLWSLGKPVEPKPAGRVIASYMENFPGHLWKPALRVSPWIGMKIETSGGRFGYLEPIPVTLSLRNSAQMPIALESGQAAPTQVVLQVVPGLQGRAIAALPLRVLDMQRRLRLEPGESVEVRTRLDSAALAIMTGETPVQTLSVDATAILGPRALPSGGVTPAPVGALTWLNAVEIRGASVTPESVAAQIESARSGSGVARLRALAWLGQVVEKMPEDTVDAEELRRQIADVVNELYPQLNTVEQAWAVRFAGRPEQGESRFTRVLDLAARSDDPLVRITYLATHVAESESPQINAALRHANPQIRRFAEALKIGLAADAAARDAASQNPEQLGGGLTGPSSFDESSFEMAPAE